MSFKASNPKEGSHGGERRSQTQQGTATLWHNQDEMKRYVLKLKSELDEQKNKIKRVHRDKAEEIKRLQENLDNEKQKAIENVAKKLQSDKAYELKKMREAVSKQKESELREVLRLKDEEMRAMRQELHEWKNKDRILEFENKRILNERSRGETNEVDHKRLRGEVAALKQDKKRLEERLRVKTQADFEKAELIRKMGHDHDVEVQRLTREAKKEALKEFRHLQEASRQLEEKNHQLATRETELRRLEMEKNSLGTELNSQRKKTTPESKVRKSSSFNMKKPVSELEHAAEDKIKKLKMRNSELVAIARKLEVKAKQLQEEKDILERSSESSPEVGHLKKAFARQRAKDLAEHAKLLMNKDNEINNLKKEVQGSCDGLNEYGNVDELTKLVEHTAKERLLLEKQLSSKEQLLSEKIRELNEKNVKILNDNEMLKEELLKLQDVEAKHLKTMFELDQIRQEYKVLQQNSLEKDDRISKLVLDNESFLAKNNALQQRNEELSTKVIQLEKLEDAYLTLKNNIHNLRNEYDVLMKENSELRSQIENISTLREEIDKLQKENRNLQHEKKDFVLKLQERESEISSLHQVQNEAQRKHGDDVSELSAMIHRLKSQSVATPHKNDMEIQNSSLNYLNSTPKDSKCTQTSRPSSPTLISSLSPIMDHPVNVINDLDAIDTQDLLRVPDNGTNSSTSFDLEKAATRIDQLAVSDSEDTDGVSSRRTTESPFLSSELSSDDKEGDDTSYSADVSQTSDLEQTVEEVEENVPSLPDGTEQHDADVFIGSPSPDIQDIDEKLSIFIAKYNYDPMLYSPNENPEMELAFQAGDYLYVYGDVDEDGFFVGELMSGERGLVPSNFIERIAEEDEAILKGSYQKGDLDNDSEEDSSEEEIILKDEDGKQKVIRRKAFSERRHEMFRTSLDHVLSDQLGDIRESDEDELDSLYDRDVAINKRRNDRTEVDQNFSDGLHSTESDTQSERVSSPSKLSLDRQFTTSALVSWQGVSGEASEEIQGYNVYVDGKLKTHIKGNNKTNTLVEDIYPSETYRLSVRTKSVHGNESPINDATIVFGPGAKLSPYDLKVSRITEVSAEITWVPANSCYGHEIFLADSSLVCLKPSISTYTLNELTPSTGYRVRVRTQVPNEVQSKLGQVITENDLSSEVEFATSPGGLPDPPVNLRFGQQTPDEIILTWLPVTISQNGYSNGFKVTNYKVYVNDIYCTETDCPSVDSVTISNERLRELGKRHDFTRMRFVVRTQSVVGESVDSNVVEVLSEDTGEFVVSHSLDLKNLDINEIKIVDGSTTMVDHNRNNINHDSNEGLSNSLEDNTISSDEPLSSNEPKLSSVEGDIEPPTGSNKDIEQKLFTAGEREEELITTGEPQDELCTTRERKNDIYTTGEEQEELYTMGGKQGDICNTGERQVHLFITEEKHEDLCTTGEREEGPSTTGERQEELCTTGDREEGVFATREILEDLRTTDESEEEQCSTGERQEDLGTSEETQEDLVTSGVRQEDISFTGERQEELGTPGERQEGLLTSMERQENLGTSRERQEDVRSSRERQEDLGTSRERREDLGTSRERQENPGPSRERQEGTSRESTSRERQEDLGTSRERQEDLGTSSEGQEDLGTSRARQEGLGTSRERQEDLGTSMEKQEDLGTSREIQEDLGTSRERQEDLRTSRETQEDISATEGRQENQGTSGERQEDLSTAEEGQEDVCTTGERTGHSSDNPSHDLSDDISSPFEDESDSSPETAKENSSKESDHEIPLKDFVPLRQSTPVAVNNRGPLVVHYNTQEEETESESSPALSMTETEEELVEIFAKADKIIDAEHGRQNIEQTNNLSEEDNMTENEKLSNTVIIKPLSDSETETDFGEVLSVIHEVDEDNLTTTSDSLTEKLTLDSRRKESRNDNLKLPDTSQSSVRSDSRTKTFSSDDEGFKTEDEVLDLLEDKEGDFVPSTEARMLAIPTIELSDDNMVAKDDVVAKENETSDGRSGVDEDASLTVSHKTSSSHQTSSSDTLPKNENINRDMDSREDVVFQASPIRTSFNSDSFSSTSDTPPHPDEAVDTIIKTLEASREPGSGASDVNDSVLLGSTSERMSEVFSDSARSGSEADEITSDQVRYFVALYEYDPLIMSPNEDGADEELPFNEGDIIKVYGDKDDDGFFWGECRRRQGFVPSNMITEVPIEEAEEMFNEATSACPTPMDKPNGHCEIDVDMVTTDFLPTIPYEEPTYRDRLSFWDAADSGDLGPRTMKALYDYNPARDSPNVDREVELMFHKGEIIYVFGDMDDDGFFQGELHGIRGLVPSNFLEPLMQDSDSEDNLPTEIPLVSSPKPSTSKNEEHQPNASPTKQPNGTTKGEEEHHKKKKGLFSKGKKIFKKAFLPR